MAWNRKLKYILLALCYCSWAMPAWAQQEAPTDNTEEGAYYWDQEEPLEEESYEAVDDNYDEESYQEPSSLTPQKPTSFDKKKWKESTDGLNYTGEREPEEPIEETYEPDEDPNRSEPWQLFSFLTGLSALVQTLIILSVIALLVVIIYAIIRSGLFDNKRIDRQASDAQTLEELEENIHESDLERALRLALEKQDYRMAIRIYYLIIIKELSIRHWIIWKRDKTNGEYVREMSARNEYEQFRNITIDFDRVWYGDISVGEAEYQVLHPRFRQFLDQLKTPGKA